MSRGFLERRCRLSVGIASACCASRRLYEGKRGITKRLYKALLLYLSNKRKKEAILAARALQRHFRRRLDFGDFVRASVRRPCYQREHKIVDLVVVNIGLRMVLLLFAHFAFTHTTCTFSPLILLHSTSTRRQVPCVQASRNPPRAA